MIYKAPPGLIPSNEEMRVSQELIDAITEMNEEKAIKLAGQLLERGKDPLQVLDACRKAMVVVGDHFEQGKAFIPELILAGEMLRQISDLVKPRLVQKEPLPRLGRIVFGTVQGDIHDLAKDIVAFMLEINGFKVHDLGVDVPPEGFVRKVEETGARILGLSGFLTLSFEPMKTTIESLERAGLRTKVKVMIGGGPVNEHVRQYTGADAWGRDAMAAVRLAQGWSGVSND